MKNIVVIKCGGSTLDQLSDEFFKGILRMKEAGKHPIIVHGGGPAIKKVLSALRVESEFVDGLRRTTKDVMEVVEMVLAGKVNKYLAGRFHSNGMKAVGISGLDSGLLKAAPRDEERLGFVGDVMEVNTTFLRQLLTLDVVPVIAPIGFDETGQTYNINADTAAGAVASALDAEKLLFVTDVPGIMKDTKLVEKVTAEEVNRMIRDGVIHGGMVPKVEAALKTLEKNVSEVMIVSGTATGPLRDGMLRGTAIIKHRPRQEALVL